MYNITRQPHYVQSGQDRFLTIPKLTISLFKAILLLEIVELSPLCQISLYLTACYSKDLSKMAQENSQ